MPCVRSGGNLSDRPDAGAEEGAHETDCWHATAARTADWPGGIAVASATGLWSLLGREPLTPAPSGRFLLVRRTDNRLERQLVATGSPSLPDQILETEVGTTFLTAVLSPDQHRIALLKRVLRGSMPTDAIGIYDRASLRRIAIAEVQIAFQRTPTFSLGWSADGSRLAVPYNSAVRTLIFGISNQPTVGLQAMIRRAAFQFHPKQADRALYESDQQTPTTINIVEVDDRMQEQVIETIEGSDAQWSPSGTHLAYRANSSTGTGNRLIIRNEATRQAIRSFDLHITGMAWAPNSRHIAVLAQTKPDPLGLMKLIPPDLIPGLSPTMPQPSLFIYDLASDRMTTIRDLDPSFQLVRLAWLSSDWLLVLGMTSANSFITDRYSEKRINQLPLDDYTPLLAWIAG